MKVYTSYSDAELAGLIRVGDAAAFTEIYNRYWPKLFLHSRHMLSDDDQAQDVVQEVFSWIWQHYQDVNLNQSLSSYLYGAIRNKVLNLVKHEKVKALKFADIAAYMTSGQHGLDEELNYQELVRIIDDEIALMPPKMREIFELSRHSDLSHKVIAEQLGISEQTVRKQVQRALRLLRARLGMQTPAIVAILYLIKNH